jgi:CheY-like chemotaxis protein
MARIPIQGLAASLAVARLAAGLRSWLRWADAPRPAAAPWPRATAPPRSPATAARPRVLVVDDRAHNRLTMAAMLGRRGLVPMQAADGAEAVALACGLRFDIILMDLKMPILDGLAATRQIRRFEARHGRAAVPVVACSDTPLDAAELAVRGIDDLLLAPCSGPDLEACLRRWCTGFEPAAAR